MREVPFIPFGPLLDDRFSLEVVEKSEDRQMGVVATDKGLETHGLRVVLLVGPDLHQFGKSRAFGEKMVACTCCCARLDQVWFGYWMV